MPELLNLHNPLSPGDVAVMTAAIKALHKTYPGRFVTDYSGNSPELLLHNPYITPMESGRIRNIDMGYPVINQSNQKSFHFVEGYTEFLSAELGLEIERPDIKPDIYISDEERRSEGQVQRMVGERVPYWILVAGGKYDYTAKWWDQHRFQEVVRDFAGKICFVQVGDHDHFHPNIEGVLDLRGKTDMRELVNLVYNAQGVLCPVTLLMHLAAGVPCPDHFPPSRACVVVAGGREPPHWEAYPTHQFIHTVGALECCSLGGCWKSRAFPLKDGDIKDLPSHLCSNPIKRSKQLTLPKCLDMIKPEEVIRRILLYFEDGREYLTSKQYEKIKPLLT